MLHLIQNVPLFPGLCYLKKANLLILTNFLQFVISEYIIINFVFLLQVQWRIQELTLWGGKGGGTIASLVL